MTTVQGPTTVFTLCVLFCAVIFWSERLAWARRLYQFVPPIVLVCYLPATASSFGFLPNESPAYDWIGYYLLPFSLFLLMVASDFRAAMGVGRAAVIVTLFGTAGVILGAPLAYLVGRAWLPPDGWTALAAIAGGWIGGPANFAAMVQAVDVPKSLVGPALVVDTAIAFTWLGVLLVLAGRPSILDRLLGASRLQPVREHLFLPAEVPKEDPREFSVTDVLLVVGCGLGSTIACARVAEWLSASVSPAVDAAVPGLGDILSGYSWLIILVTTLGIVLSLTPFRRIERSGATVFGYGALYVFLATLGAQADLSGIMAAPGLLLVGAIWLLLHIAFVLAGARVVGADAALAAIGSMANIGGTVSTPVLAAAYARTLVPVGLLLAVMCNVIGTYCALLCAYLLRLVAEG